MKKSHLSVNDQNAHTTHSLNMNAKNCLNTPSHTMSICIALVSLFLTGCYKQFYSTGTKEPPVARDLVNVRDGNKEIILHFEDSIVHLQKMMPGTDTLVGTTALLPLELSKRLNPKRKRGNGYRRRKDPTAINQAHIYVKGRLSHYTEPGESIVHIPHAKIHRMDVYERDGTAIAFNYTMSTIGILAGVLVSLFALWLAFGASSGF